jgi:hypothetical protein
VHFHGCLRDILSQIENLYFCLAPDHLFIMLCLTYCRACTDIDPELTHKQEQRYIAETLYYHTRTLWPPKKDAFADTKLEGLREILDDLRENQKTWRPDEPENYFGFMERMYLQHSRVMGAEGEWNKMLQKRSQEFEEREQAEFEEYQAQKRVEAKEVKARELEKVELEAIEAAGRMFCHDDQDVIATRSV